MTRTAVVIGAGLAGTAAALHFRDRGWRVTVLDKSPRGGGRLATRRVPLADGTVATFDHGCQHLTATAPAFVAFLDRVRAAGVPLGPWDGGVASPLGMRAIATALHPGLDVRLGQLVTSVTRTPTGWRVAGDGVALDGDVCVVTPPVPQAVALLPADAFAADVAAELTAVTYDRCLTAMAVLSPADRPTPNDNHAKGVSAVGPAVTVFADPAESLARWDGWDDAAAAALAARVGPVRHAVAHRWKFARVTAGCHRPFAPAACGTLAVAGDAFGGPHDAQAAYLSGLAAAAHLTGDTA